MQEVGASKNLLLVLLSSVVTASLSGSAGALALNTAGTGTTVGRGERKVNVLLRVETDNERGNVDDLLADAVESHPNTKSVRLIGVTQDENGEKKGNVPDVSLDNEDTGVVDALCKTALEDLGLETALKEVLDLKGEHVVEPHAALVEHTNAN